MTIETPPVHHFELSIHFDTDVATVEEAVAAFREWLANSESTQDGCVRIWNEDGTITYVDGNGSSWTG